jgi:ribosomal protein L10
MSRPLELLHLDLFGPVLILASGEDKSETQETLKSFLRRAQNEFELKVKTIRSDNG